MRSSKTFTILVLGLMVSLAMVGKAAPMGTAFTYQGRLIDANSAADGEHDFQFAVFDDPVPGVGIMQGYIDVNNLDVIDGYFTVELDFGSDVFKGDARWLEIALRPGDSNDPKAFVKLSPRYEVTPTPYALYAKSAGSQAPIQVSGSFDFPAAVIEATNTSTGNGYAISGVQSNKGTVGYLGGYYGVYGRHDSNMNYGYLGGSGYGVYGRNINENYGYLGSDSYGVYGSSFSGVAGYFASSAGYGLIVESGNVGIGTTNPRTVLEVAGPTGLRVSTGLGPNVYGEIKHGDSNGLQINAAALSGWADISLQTHGTTKLFVESAGNVGIGTTTPSKELEVISKNIGGGIKVYGDASTGSHDSPGFQLGGKDIGGNDRAGDLSLALSDGHFSSNATKGDLVLRAEDTNIHFSTQSSGGFPAKMTIKSDGKIGIGTTNPPTILALGTGVSPIISVASTDGSDSSFLGLAGGGALSDFRGSSIALHGNEHFNKGTMWFRVGWDAATMTGANHGDLIIETANTERFRIDKGGNVGIGTTNPSAKLYVNNGNLIVSKADDTSWTSNAAILAAANSDKYVSLAADGFHAMWVEDTTADNKVVFNAGNVGIGTTSPSSKLHGHSSEEEYRATAFG
jgi:hypothetical protein